MAFEFVSFEKPRSDKTRSLIVAILLVSSSIVTFLAFAGIGAFTGTSTTPVSNQATASPSFVIVPNAATQSATSPSTIKTGILAALAPSNLQFPDLSNSNAKIWTNKADYPPGSLVTIYGSDFSPDANVSLTLTNPDNSTYSWSVFANSTGAFTTTYQLIVMGHLYFVVATDGTNTAETTFTDSGLGLDTACQGFGSSATSTTVTTASITCAAGDVIIVFISSASNNLVSSITDSLSTHLTYTGRCSTSSCGATGHNSESVEEYYAITSSAATFTITATMAGTSTYDIYAFGITGANTASPFDADFTANSLLTGHSSSGAPTVTGVSTANTNDIIVGLVGVASTTLETASSPFTLVGSAHDQTGQGIAAEDEIVSTTQSGITVSFGTSPGAEWTEIVDAVEAVPAPTLTLAPTSGPPGQVITLTGSNYATGTTYSDCLSTSSSSISCVSGSTSTFATGAGTTIPSNTLVTVPSGTTAANDFVIVYLSTTITSTAAFTVNAAATLTATPTSGPPGQVITLSTTTSNYAHSISYNDCLSTSSSSVACIAGSTGSFTSSSTGTIPSATTVTVPSGTASGSDFVIVYSGSSSVVSSASFTVNPTATVTITPTTGPPTQVISLASGSNYAISTSYNDCLSTSQTSTASCISGSTNTFTSSASGTITSGTVTVPSGTAAGNDFVIVYSGSSSIVASAAFSVISLTLTTTSGPVGQVVTLAGSNYATLTTYNDCLSTSSTSTSSCIVASESSFTTTTTSIPSGTTMTVPSGTTAGSDYMLVYSGTTVISWAAFTVTTATLTVTPTTGPPGQVVTLSTSSTGYSDSTSYGYCLSTSSTSVTCVTGTTGTFTSSAGGAIPSSTTLTVPSGTSSGSYFVIVYSGSISIVSQAAFTVNPAATLTVAPVSGPPTQVISLSSSTTNYAVSTSYNDCLSTSSSSVTCVSGSTGTFTSTSSGGIPSSATVTVPSGTAAANDFVIVYSGTSSILASAAFSVISLTLTPTTGPPGQVTTLAGSNYATLTTYSDCLSTSSTSTSSCIVASESSFTTTTTSIPSGTTITVPSGTAAGSDFVLVYSGSTVVTFAAFTVNSAATLTLSPTSGFSSSTTTLTGANYADSTSYGDCLSTSSSSIACVTGSTGTFTSSSGGAIPSATTVTIPSGTAPGTYSVIVYSGGASIVSSATYTVNPSVTQSITLTVAAGSTATFTLSGCSVTPTSIPGNGAAQTVTATPSCTITITVPTDWSEYTLHVQRWSDYD